jgi:hypothetical protein
MTKNPGRILLTQSQGTSPGSIRNRISALRVKQRNLYEELGWDMPEGGAARKKDTPKTPKKRAGDDGDESTPSKKPRAKKAKKEVSPEVENEGESEEKGVKEEDVEV